MKAPINGVCIYSPVSHMYHFKHHLVQTSLFAWWQQAFRLVPMSPIPALLAVNHIVLQDEQHVEEYANLAEAKLDRVTRDAAPVVLEPAVDPLLRDAQHAARQVQQDLPDAPALGALVADVGAQLRRVLDERHDELDVAEGVDDVEVAPVDGGVNGVTAARDTHDEVGDGDADEGASGQADGEAARAGGGVADRRPPWLEGAEPTGMYLLRVRNPVFRDTRRTRRSVGGHGPLPQGLLPPHTNRDWPSLRTQNRLCSKIIATTEQEQEELHA